MRLTRFKARVARDGAETDNSWSSAQVAGDADARFLFECIVMSGLKVSSATLSIL